MQSNIVLIQCLIKAIIVKSNFAVGGSFVNKHNIRRHILISVSSYLWYSLYWVCI